MKRKYYATLIRIDRSQPLKDQIENHVNDMGNKGYSLNSMDSCESMGGVITYTFVWTKDND